MENTVYYLYLYRRCNNFMNGNHWPNQTINTFSSTSFLKYALEKARQTDAAFFFQMSTVDLPNSSSVSDHSKSHLCIPLSI